ncbi:hypothetical protein N7451_010412 [Penicillium sp. IBT 35674x]|nr:hypothetical protein N7451_010412 [Penicillium sp. IBT 35674x]
MVSIQEIIGPAPAGVDLSADRTKADNAVVISLSILAVIAVVVRFYLRLKGGSRISGSYILMIAWSQSHLGTLWNGETHLVDDGRGYDNNEEGENKHPSERPWLIHILFSYLFIYIFELFIVKISLLLFYRRIFGSSGSYWICIILASGWTTGSMIALLTCPSPVSYFWSELSNPGGGNYRYDFYNYYIGNAASNVVTDFLILLVPIPVIWKLKMRFTQKIMVSGVLLLGIFVCAISIVRLHYITFLKNNIDLTWTISSVYVWSTLEPCIAIICACLPALQPVIQSAMKLEYILHIRARFHPSKRARQVLRLQKHLSNSSNSSSHGLRPITLSIFRPGSVEPSAEIETQCAPVTTASPTNCAKMNKNLEEYLGPMYIMVQHDVEWSETHVHIVE